MTAEFKRTIAIAELTSRYQPLTLALEEAGLSTERIEQLLRESISLRCIQCGASTPGASFIALGVPNPEAIAPSTELQRLSQRHCLAEKCPCCFYDLRFAAVEGIDWELIWTAAERIREECRLKAERPDRRWFSRLVEKHGAVPLAAAALLILALTCFVYSRLRTPAWARPVPVYRGDTNTTWTMKPGGQ